MMTSFCYFWQDKTFVTIKFCKSEIILLFAKEYNKNIMCYKIRKKRIGLTEYYNQFIDIYLNIYYLST